VRVRDVRSSGTGSLFTALIGPRMEYYHKSPLKTRIELDIGTITAQDVCGLGGQGRQARKQGPKIGKKPYDTLFGGQSFLDDSYV